MKNKIWLVALGVLLALGLLLAGTVVAQEPQNGSEWGPGFRGRMPGRGWGEGVDCPVGGLGLRMGGMWGGTSLVGVVAEQLDVEVSEVAQALADGQTLREIIVAKGGDPEAIVEAFVQARRQVLDELVAQGRITRAQADELTAHLREEASEHLDEEDWNCGLGRPFGGMMGPLGRGGCGAWGSRVNPTPGSPNTWGGSGFRGMPFRSGVGVS
ncbi:MAG: hypothetical protein H5T69_20355 [Chloroflexi bacterium]|nr:hypothetical protein [Chloroflexota bacterium]